ncbi:MAG TPA: ATP-binding cassette domain-containing protein, partial [Aggregatilineaceae bacterium]|nr:ATP-binding cassette domain-containing protein [Aggregatilineaceae bacterium]
MAVIETHELRRTFKTRKETVEAVQGINLRVQAGEIFGFLGPNGAGKTTTMRILATLMPPTSGSAQVAGYDLARQPGSVRQHIGYVGQVGGAEGSATGYENLLLQGRMYHMDKTAAETRAKELVQALDLESFSERLARTYSGGQRRRLELALGMMNKPKLLFLDEPTTGLDPQTRAHLWDEIRRLREGGTTIFLTTHYLEEADELCDRIAIIDHGQIVGEGTPETLKQQIAGDIITLALEAESMVRAQNVLTNQAYVREIHPLGDG